MGRLFRLSITNAVLPLLLGGCRVGSVLPLPEFGSSARAPVKEQMLDGIRVRSVPNRMYMAPFVLRDTPDVRRFQRTFLRGQRAFINDAMNRRHYLSMMQMVMKQHSLPPDLANIALVESRLLPDARSRSGAVGLWQFMRPTARRFGLAISPLNDERKDPLKSTIAAARYLTYLYDRFDDWFLAIAAYNSGPARLSRVIKREGTRDFFELTDRGALRKETSDFVYKFIAVTMILREPNEYGFTG